MRTGGIVKYSSSNPDNFIQEAYRSDLRHSKLMQVCLDMALTMEMQKLAKTYIFKELKNE